MSGWFKWNGVKSTDLGIYVSEHPPITYPNERAEYINVPGRSGSLAMLEGEEVYDDLTLSAQCSMRDASRINEIGAWLRGSGTVEFGNRTGGYFKARIANQVPFAQIMRGKKNLQFAVSFRCKPFWYSNDDTAVVLASNGTISNPGNAACEPRITVTAAGDYTLVVNGCMMEVTGGSIIIDSELRDCLSADGASLANGRVTMDEFPKLDPGANNVSWTGNVTKVEIVRRVRYL